jgi:hypothetical protein
MMEESLMTYVLLEMSQVVNKTWRKNSRDLVNRVPHVLCYKHNTKPHMCNINVEVNTLKITETQKARQ